MAEKYRSNKRNIESCWRPKVGLQFAPTQLDNLGVSSGLMSGGMLMDLRKVYWDYSKEHCTRLMSGGTLGG